MRRPLHLPPCFRAARIAVLALVLWAPSAYSQGLEKMIGGSVRPILESLQLEDLDGEKVQMASFLGSGPVVLDFWATWCKPCLMAMPELEALYDDYRERGLQVVGINEDGPRNAAKVKPFMRSNGYSFPVLLDMNRVAQRRLNALALPTTLVLDAEGTVVHASFGFRSGEIEKLRDVIGPLLNSETNE